MSRLDFTQPPFDVLNANERDYLKKHAKILYLGKQQFLTDSQYPYFYVILKGHIQQSLNGDEVGDFVASTYSNDWFDARKQLDSDHSANIEATATSNSTVTPAGQPQNQPQSQNQSQSQNQNQPITQHSYRYQALEDSLLLQISAPVIDKLSQQNYHIRNLLGGELAQRMQAYHARSKPGAKQSSPQSNNNRNVVQHPNLGHPTASNTADINSSLQPQEAQTGAHQTTSLQAESQQLMLQPVTAINMLGIHTVPETASLYEAAKTMTQAGLKHVLVKRIKSLERIQDTYPQASDCKQNSLGILTDADICRAVSEQVDMSTALCRDHARFKLHTIAYDQDVSEALLAMIRYRVHRLPVLDANQEVMGVLGQSDLLAFLSHHSQLITVQIDQAQTIESLKKPVEQIGRYIRSQHHNGIKIGVISRIVQVLNAHVFAKLWRLLVPDTVFNNTCIIVMGSEGRGEQIMRTDQDNALLIKNGFSHPDLATYADQFNQTLAQMGYPLCDGYIMMNNPQWRMPLSEFKSQVSGWFHQKEPEHSIWLASLLDASYVCGDEHLLDDLRKHLQVAHRSADPMFIRSFAQAALQFGDVSQWWKKFMPLIGKPLEQDIDLKKAGIFPLVHGIRTMALEQDIFEVTSSKARLQALVRAEVLSAKRAETLNDVLEFFMAQRLDIALTTEDKTARQVDPTTLSALERDLLKECLNLVKSFKNELRQRYQLDIA